MQRWAQYRGRWWQEQRRRVCGQPQLHPSRRTSTHATLRSKFPGIGPRQQHVWAEVQRDSTETFELQFSQAWGTGATICARVPLCIQAIGSTSTACKYLQSSCCCSHTPRSVEALETPTLHNCFKSSICDLRVANAQGPQKLARVSQGNNTAIGQLDDRSCIKNLEVGRARCEALDGCIANLCARHVELTQHGVAPGPKRNVRDLRTTRQVQGLQAKVEQQLRCDVIRNHQPTKGKTQDLEERRTFHDTSQESLGGDLSTLAD
mmetsp:Transcript_100539/g.322660  ORF Transcript_100539/g.322660 Transcript_100539/m.322660 type:complete len:263 (+) Transcript_100539:1145-1933(+)